MPRRVVHYVNGIRSEEIELSSSETFIYGMLGTIVLSAVIIIGYRLKPKKWQKGFISRKLEHDSNNLLEAHIYLGTQMIQADRKDSKGKVIYMSKYFQRYFPYTRVNFIDVMNEAFKQPADLNIMGKWINGYLSHKQKIQVIYFLAGLSVVDGHMDQREINLLREMSELLNLSPKEFDSIIAMYKQKEQRRKSKSSSRPKSASAKKTLIVLACEILGVSEHASINEIKKAYRKLVKIHHPDRFYNESDEEQNIAQERFVEIQNAYEMIEKYK